jgi:hypothetical protein
MRAHGAVVQYMHFPNLSVLTGHMNYELRLCLYEWPTPAAHRLHVLQYHWDIICVRARAASLHTQNLRLERVPVQVHAVPDERVHPRITVPNLDKQPRVELAIGKPQRQPYGV